jgi:transcription elongation factor GreA
VTLEKKPSQFNLEIGMNDPSYLTAEGYERLKKELAELKGPARLSISARLRAAIQMGDLSENADYINAKEDQGFLEGRILDLDSILRNTVIIDETPKLRETVDIGSHITVQEEDDLPETYYLVGPKEADPKNGRISHESPIGRALLGRRVGDVALASTPGGDIRLKILNIE